MPSITNVNAAQAVVQIVGDNNNLAKVLENSTGRLAIFANSALAIGTRLSIIGVEMLAPFKEAVSVFAAFDDAMRTVASVASTTASSFQVLTNQAKQLGASTSFTAQQVADGMAALGRMGFGSGQISASISSMMDLSKATGTELAQAAEIAANNMAVFGINASQAEHVADILAITANSSAQKLEDLGEALKTAGPFAASAGQSLEQAAAAIGVLANMGIRGAMAGTALAKSYKRLSDASVRKYLKEMFNIDPTDGNGRLRDTATVLGEIGKAIRDLGSAERISVLDRIFEARGALGGGTLSVNTEAIDKLLVKINSLDGYASRAARKMESGLGGSMRVLSSSMEGLKISIGDALEPMLTSLVNSLSSIIGSVKEFVTLNRSLVVGLTAVVGALTGIATVLASLGAAIGIVKSITMAISVFSTAFQFTRPCGARLAV